jgi:hypothetical protein
MCASIAQIKKHIVSIEQVNEELIQQMQHLRHELEVVLEDRDQANTLCVQAQSKLDVVSWKLVELWPMIQQVAPQFPNNITPIAPTQCVELLAYAWSQLVENTNMIQQKMDEIQLKEQE